MRVDQQSLVCISLVAVMLLGGCRSDSKQKRRTGSAKGTVTKIDLASNDVSMKITHPRTGREMDVNGTLTAETEVWINGVRKTPADVEVNDDIKVEYVRTGEDLDQRFVVSRVEVTRTEDWKRTTPAASTEPGSLAKPGGTREDLLKADRIAEVNDGGSTAVIDPRLAAGSTTEPVNRAAKEQEITDVIYAEIRRRLNEATAERAALLNAGKPATDPEVTAKETIIRKARSLLMERGENVEPIDPPLPEDLPTTQPAT